MNSEAKAHLFVGPAGTGKTKALLDIYRQTLIDAQSSGLNEPSYFILPNKEHTDRIHSLLLRDSRVKGLANHHILTINDFLRFKVIYDKKRHVTQFERRWMLRQILKSHNWQWFEKSKEKIGLSVVLSDLIREFRVSGMDSKRWKNLIMSNSPYSDYDECKYLDIEKVLHLYDSLCQSRGVANPEDSVYEFAHWCKKQSAPSMNQIIFDGFFSFTPSQLVFIQSITNISRETYVSLTTEATGLSQQRKQVFYYPGRMRKYLLSNRFQERIFESETNLRFKTKELFDLEQNLFSSTKKDVESSDKKGGSQAIRLLSASSAMQELQMIAKAILKNVRHEKYFFSDHMIILRSILNYRSMIEEVFQSYDIPVQIHERKRLSENNLIRFILSWMRIFDSTALDGEGGEILNVMDRSSLIGFIKQYGIVGKDAPSEEVIAIFSKIPLIFNQDHLTSLDLNLLSDKVRGSVQIFIDKINEFIDFDSGKRCIQFFESMIQRYHDLLFPTISQRDFASHTNDSEHCLGLFRKMLEESVLAIESDTSDIRGALDKLQGELEMGLYSTSVYNKNQVQVYDTSLALPKEYPVVFISGLSQDRFPKRHFNHPIIPDKDRIRLRENGLFLDTASERRHGEKYLFYMAATGATKQLYLTHSKYNSAGHFVSKSQFIDEVMNCVDVEVDEKALTDVVPNLEDIYSEQEVWNSTVWNSFHGSNSSELQHAYRWLSGEMNLTSSPGVEFSVLHWLRYFESLSGGQYINQLNDEAIKDSFFRRQKPYSASELSTLRNCHYQHFAKYILRIKPLEENNTHRIEGQILHLVLEKLFKQYFESKPKRNTMPNLDQFVVSGLKYLENACSECGLDDTLENYSQIRINLLKKDLERILKAEYHDLISRENLRPTHFELSFGFSEEEDSSLDFLKLKREDEEIKVRGRIDRIDMDDDGNALIVDYKRAGGFSFSEFKQGLLPQGWVYSLVLQQLMKKLVIGVEFITLKNMKRSGFFKKEAYDSIRPSNRLRNKFSDDEYAEIMDEIVDDIFQDIKKFRNANIEAKSIRCRYCDYGELCRYEGWRNRQ